MSVNWREYCTVKSKRVLSRGSSYWRTYDEVLAVTWMDNKPVHFLTTLHNPDEIPITDRSVKCRGKKDEKEAAVIICPLLVLLVYMTTISMWGC